MIDDEPTFSNAVTNGQPVVPVANPDFDRFKIELGEPDRFGRKRLVRLLDRGRELHRDSIDADSEFFRKAFAEGAWQKVHGAADDPDATVDFVKSLIVDAIQAEGSGPGESDSITYPVITAADLATTRYDVSFYIEGMVPVGQPQGRFGAKKALKTTLACAEGFAISTGLSFLNYFRVTRTARVGFFSGESGMATIQETMLRIARDFDTDLATVDMIFSDRLPMLGSLRHMDALERYIVDNGIEVLYIDPAYLAMLTAGNEGSIFAMGALLRALSEMCQRLGVTPILLHHMKKGVIDQYSPGDLDDASWAGFAEFCRSWMLINRREKYEPGSGIHRLWLSVGGSIGHGGLWGLNIDEGQYTGPGSRIWRVEVLKAEDVRDEARQNEATAKEAKVNAKLEDVKKAILSAVVKLPEHRGTLSEIRTRTGRNGQTFALALAELVSDGDLIACEILKGNNRSYEGYELRKDDA